MLLTLEVLFCTAVAEGTTGTEGIEGGNLPNKNNNLEPKEYNSGYDPNKPKDKNNKPSVNETYPNHDSYNDISQMYEDMFKENRTPEQIDFQRVSAKSFLSGFPIIGPFIRGYDSYKQLEDLYKNTGKVPAYPGASGVGAGGLGSAVGNSLMSANRIFNGFNDLYQFYTGEPDAFRGMMNNAYM